MHPGFKTKLHETKYNYWHCSNEQTAKKLVDQQEGKRLQHCKMSLLPDMIILPSYRTVACEGNWISALWTAAQRKAALWRSHAEPHWALGRYSMFYILIRTRHALIWIICIIWSHSIIWVTTIYRNTYNFNYRDCELILCLCNPISAS